MLSIHKTYFYIFCFCVLSLFLAPALLPFSDELCLAAFAALAGLDMLYNRNLRRYRLMFVLLGVMLFYLAYSLAASPYNIPKAQINDFILQCKPLVAFSLSYAIAPKFTAGEKYFLKNCASFWQSSASSPLPPALIKYCLPTSTTKAFYALAAPRSIC